MNNNIKNTKKHLTIMFSIIVFLVVLSMGIIFFSVKYYREISIENKEFGKLINVLEKGEISVNDLMILGSVFGDEKIKHEGLRKEHPLDLGFKPKGFFNFVLYGSGGKVISNNVRDDISKDYITQIYNNNAYDKSKQSKGFLIKKISLKNSENLIILKKIGYSLYDYLGDIFGFTIISVIFGIIIYFIGGKFVNRAFIPVEENMKDMKAFIHNAGHELKTPISVMDSNIQLLDDMKIYDPDMTRELKVEVLRLNSIIDSLIKLSDIGLFKNLENNNLNDILEQIVRDLKYKIFEKNIKIDIKVDKKIEVKSNKDYFYIFLSNLIGNAIKYNVEGGSINILYKNGELIISDTGIGISKENVEKIFDRFFKVDKSRNTDGFGIGLSLVKKISEIYNWKITVISEKEKGTSLLIKF